MTHLKRVSALVVSTLVAVALVCCGGPTVRRVESVACADLDAIEALAIAVERGAGAPEQVVDATRAAIAVLRAVCAVRPTTDAG